MSKEEKIVIVITIINQEVIRDYMDIHPELILADFLENPNAFLESADIICDEYPISSIKLKSTEQINHK